MWSRGLFRRNGADARLHGGLSCAATVEEVVEMAPAVSPRSDPERLNYRMRALLKRGDDGRVVWKCDQRYRRPSDFAVLLEHLAGFEARVPNMAAPFLLARAVTA
jgi:hypothetical protein